MHAGWPQRSALKLILYLHARLEIGLAKPRSLNLTSYLCNFRNEPPQGVRLPGASLPAPSVAIAGGATLPVSPPGGLPLDGVLWEAGVHAYISGHGNRLPTLRVHIKRFAFPDAWYSCVPIELFMSSGGQHWGPVAQTGGDDIMALYYSLTRVVVPFIPKIDLCTCRGMAYSLPSLPYLRLFPTSAYLPYLGVRRRAKLAPCAPLNALPPSHLPTHPPPPSDHNLQHLVYSACCAAPGQRPTAGISAFPAMRKREMHYITSGAGSKVRGAVLPPPARFRLRLSEKQGSRPSPPFASGRCTPSRLGRTLN